MYVQYIPLHRFIMMILLRLTDYATSQALPSEDYAHPSSHADRMQEDFEAVFGGVFPDDDPQGPTSHQPLQETHLQLVDQGSHDPFSDHVIPDIPQEAGQWEGAAESEEVPRPPLGKDVEEGEVSDSSGETEESQAQSKLVANFYDKLAQPDADKRNEVPYVYPRIEPRGSISFREAIAPGSKRGRVVNGTGFYLLLVSDLASNVT